MSRMGDDTGKNSNKTGNKKRGNPKNILANKVSENTNQNSYGPQEITEDNRTTVENLPIQLDAAETLITNTNKSIDVSKDIIGIEDKQTISNSNVVSQNFIKSKGFILSYSVVMTTS